MASPLPLTFLACAFLQADFDFPIREPVRIHYPHPRGTVFALPHVSIIFEIHAPAAGRPWQRLEMEVDGRKVPEEAFGYCPLCAGPRPTVLAARAPWTVSDGWHRLRLLAFDGEGNVYSYERTYLVDTTIPSLSGLSGTGLFPGAEVAEGRSLRLGFGYRSGGDRWRAWLGLTRPGGLPVEVVRHFRQRGEALSWKTRLWHTEHFRLSVGQWEGNPFVAVGYRTQPSYLTLSLGAVASPLPSAWLGLTYSLAEATRRGRYPQRFSHGVALLDLVRLHLEVDEKGRLNAGVSLHHPYGFRAGLFRLGSGFPPGAWEAQIAGSVAW